jgi:phosphoribosylformylglycinamidine cyclo-ligase
LIYSGQVKLTDAVENSPIDAGQCFFANENLCTIIKKILDKYDAMAIHGMVHCGAQTKILHFVENLHHKDNLFPPLI